MNNDTITTIIFIIIIILVVINIDPHDDNCTIISMVASSSSIEQINDCSTFQVVPNIIADVFVVVFTMLIVTCTRIIRIWRYVHSA